VDRLRAHAIERLMCDFALSFADLRQRFELRAEPLIEEALAVAAEDADGLVRLDGDCLVVTPTGRPFVRAVAARFDTYLRQSAARYSIAV
jgi:oxygen-independent coproporphyrinogen-3 oxidase